MVEWWSSLPNDVPDAQGSSAGNSAETLMLSRRKVEKQRLWDFLWYDPKRKYERDVEKAIMFIAILYVWLLTVVHCSTENVKCEGHNQKEYEDTNESIVERSTEKLTGKGREFLKQWLCEEDTVKQDGFDTAGWRDLVMSMFRRVTSV